MRLLRLTNYLLLLILLVFIPLANDDDDDLIDGFSDIFAPSSYVDGQSIEVRDEQLKGSLEQRRKWLEMDPDRIYSDSGSLVFLQLSETYFREFSRKVKRKRWLDFLRFNHNSRKVVIGYSEGGETEFRMHYMDELIQNPDEDVSFAQSRVFGYAYDLDDFQMRMSVVSKLINQGKKLIKLKNSDWDILLRDVKPRALILIALINRKPGFIMASTNSVDVDLLPWSKEALKHAFMQYFVMESARDGRITNQLCLAYQNNLIDGLLHLESVIGSVRQFISRLNPKLSSSSGKMVEVQVQRSGSNRYRYTKHYIKSIEEFSKFVSANDLNRYAAMVFLEGVSEQYSLLKSEIKKAHQIAKQGWVNFNEASDLGKIIIKPLDQLMKQLNLLDQKVRSAVESHRKRFKTSISTRGEVRFQQSLDMGFH